MELAEVQFLFAFFSLFVCINRPLMMTTYLPFLEGQLPPYLYLQIDNCYRECKNEHILGFCSLVVEKEILKEVYKIFTIVFQTTVEDSS